MENVEIFEEIFENVMDELNIDAWYDLYDDVAFQIVEDRIADRFEVSDPYTIDGYADWAKEMTEGL